ncbi:MAG TPA: pantoate--beta-alanine ligase [Bryobacteraceae bacterium]|nr:pantoate--beta-alanine ligase [Bryobacteraceae bacterium]
MSEWFATIAETRRRLGEMRHAGRAIGFVPTMGALHAGHGALIERARRETDCVVVSIFVNPTQFDRPEDYEAYRIDLARDREFCEERGTNVIFAPSVEEMYPGRAATTVEVAGLSDGLCGKFRPGHFRGVATVVAKLFHIVEPNRAYFGEKDAQQLAVIRKMVADLNFPIAIEAAPTVREADGLALSSRNRRLSAEERVAAPALYRALCAAAARVREGARDAAEIRQAALDVLVREPRFRVEYVEVVDAAEMTQVDRVAGPVRVAAAAWIGATRLIDNIYAEAGP